MRAAHRDKATTHRDDRGTDRDGRGDHPDRSPDHRDVMNDLPDGRRDHRDVRADHPDRWADHRDARADLPDVSPDFPVIEPAVAKIARRSPLSRCAHPAFRAPLDGPTSRSVSRSGGPILAPQCYSPKRMCPVPESPRGAPQERPRLGRYELIAILGHGGMADVYLAVSRGPAGFNKLIVIKRLRPDLAADPSFRDMFLDEARLAARLNHPNVVSTFEVGEEGSSIYLAMEYLEGQPLNLVVREASKKHVSLPEELYARILADALMGLHYAHKLADYDGSPLRVVHRDVSPHNIFVTYDGQVKMLDFGIAKAESKATQTEVGVLKGKVAYMAPEQA